MSDCQMKKKVETLWSLTPKTDLHLDTYKSHTPVPAAHLQMNLSTVSPKYHPLSPVMV